MYSCIVDAPMMIYSLFVTPLERREQTWQLENLQIKMQYSFNIA